MHLLVISGSQQYNGASDSVAKVICQQAKTHFFCEYLKLLDYPELAWKCSYSEEEMTKRETLLKKFQQSDAIVIVVPEYSGMTPPVVKDFFMGITAHDVGFKPALLVTVSAGVGGSYPVFELRGSATKNNKLIFTPNHLIIRNVSDFLDNLDTSNVIYNRMIHSIEELSLMAKAMSRIRTDLLELNNLFPYGM
ncbi:NAD(P)H-dependent oxidoreductase [Pelistega sp. MC2]|uniref:NAD(P)H-dependent oxidoreductase n=1 Tax=Pelistega sp. MC2 TaxID=1720297 RepID=UPI0008D99074|nr:NAD(P)H-dependent oxidoreductase [Pelistega sp. MC2]